jgi:hypothetical protein
MKRDVSLDSRFSDRIEKGEFFDLITPYGYGGWIIEGDRDIKPLMDEYEKWCVENGVVCEFVRFHPMLENNKSVEGYYKVISLGNTIAMDLSSPEVIWQNITSKNRNVIRKAVKNGLTVHSSNDFAIYEQFKLIYDKTMDKDNADDYYYFSEKFYQSVCNDLKDNAKVFYAEAENGDIASAAIIIGVNGYLNYHLSGSRREYQSFAPTNLLLYEVALWGNENGYKSFHLGGGVGSKDDSLYAFKKAFYRGEPHRFSIGKKIFDEEKYNKLVEMRTDIKNSQFFPEYRG